MKESLFHCLIYTTVAILAFFVYSGTRTLQETVGLYWATTLWSFLVVFLCATLIWGGAVLLHARMFGEARQATIKLLTAILFGALAASLVAELVILGDEMAFAHEVAEQQELQRLGEMHRPRSWPNAMSDLWFTTEKGYFSTD